MTETPLYFELPENLSVKRFLNKLSKKINFQIAFQQYSIKTYYDSFDWRLYNADMICEFNHSQTASYLSLIKCSNGKLLALEEMQETPSFSGQLTESSLKTLLERHLEMRALLPLCQLPLDVYGINILNKEQKTILRIQMDEYESLTNRICLHPLKGYDKAVKKISDLLLNYLQLKPAQCTALNIALKQQGRKPKDYSSRVAIKLKPSMPADKASRVIYLHLLRAMQFNEAGTIANIDSEFLHDFRVAVRRTRSGLNQLKNILPANGLVQHIDFFAWLGQITGLTRDMDVYLLNYQKYKTALPITLQSELAPLYDFLKQKQVLAQKKLADNLNSSKYKKKLAAWEQYLNKSVEKKGKASHADITIKELADQRIWKVYRRILKEGNAINDSSPAEALHDLRKTAKKLRYLIEFFQSLYPENEIKKIIKTLKNLQTVLGDFQDYEVQEINIMHFSEEMMENQVPANTLLAMGVLVQSLDVMKCTARKDFSEQFAIFKAAKNQAVFKTLFTHNVKIKK